jgi:hypothetical protein
VVAVRDAGAGAAATGGGEAGTTGAGLLGVDWEGPLGSGDAIVEAGAGRALLAGWRL